MCIRDSTYTPLQLQKNLLLIGPCLENNFIVDGALYESSPTISEPLRLNDAHAGPYLMVARMYIYLKLKSKSTVDPRFDLNDLSYYSVI